MLLRSARGALGLSHGRVRCMSRIGRVPVKLPEAVSVRVEPYAAGSLHTIKPPTAHRLRQMMKRRPDKDSFQAFGTPHRVVVNGPLGEIAVPVHSFVDVAQPDAETLQVSAKCGGTTRLGKTMWGTTKSYIANAVRGVSQGFRKDLELQGVGFRARIEKADGALYPVETLVLRLGFTNELQLPVPPGIEISCPTQTTIAVFGFRKRQVGMVAAQIRRFRPPDAYKGKGVRYVDEVVRLKPGKRR